MDHNASAELVADVEEVFLGFWPDDLMQIVGAPYRSGVLLAYAYRDGGAHIPQEADR